MVRAVHEAEVRTAVEHIEIDGDVLLHDFLKDRSHIVPAPHGVFTGPIIKPANPKLRHHLRRTGFERFKYFEGLTNPRTEIQSSGDIRKRTLLNKVRTV